MFRVVLIIGALRASLVEPEIPMARIHIATPVKSAAPEIPAYFKALFKLTYPPSFISLYILESDSTDDTDTLVRRYLPEAEKRFRMVRYINSPSHFEAPTDRHSLDVQLKRRQVLAMARNELLEMMGLQPEDFVLWLDIDAVGFKPSLIQDLLAFNRPIVAPHLVWSFKGLTYDRNSWLETNLSSLGSHPSNHSHLFDRIDPNIAYPSHVAHFEGYAKKPTTRLYMDDFRKLLHAQNQAVPLDGVGTACLLVQGVVHLKGIKFPVHPYKNRVESEGFGLLAKDAGFDSIGLPFYEIKHVSHQDKPGSKKHGIFWSVSLASGLAIALMACFIFIPTVKIQTRKILKRLSLRAYEEHLV